MKYVLIQADGAESFLVCSPGEDEMRFIQKAVGGDFEPKLVKYNDQRLNAYVDEEAKRKKLPVNRVATDLWRAALKPHVTALGAIDDIRGPMLIKLRAKSK